MNNNTLDQSGIDKVIAEAGSAHKRYMSSTNQVHDLTALNSIDNPRNLIEVSNRSKMQRSAKHKLELVHQPQP